jgi:hypothetical protein
MQEYLIVELGRMGLTDANLVIGRLYCELMARDDPKYTHYTLFGQPLRFARDPIATRNTPRAINSALRRFERETPDWTTRYNRAYTQLSQLIARYNRGAFTAGSLEIIVDRSRTYHVRLVGYDHTGRITTHISNINIP